MFKRFRDKIAFSGITVLIVGVCLLVLTFISAYGFLTQSLSIVPSQDMVSAFGGAFAPLITACIHVMYLGVMGWIGSLVTIRGVTIIAHAPQLPMTIAKKPLEQPQQTSKLDEEKQKESEKTEAKQAEPEIFVMLPEETPTQTTECKEKKAKQRTVD
jgi:hypothetical protein